MAKATVNAPKATANTASPYAYVEAGKLDAFIKKVNATGSRYMIDLHIAAVSSIRFAAINGQVGPLNNLYNGLKPALRGAFRQYVIRLIGQSKEDQFKRGVGAGPKGWLIVERGKNNGPEVLRVVRKDAEPDAEQRRQDWFNVNQDKLLAGAEKGWRPFFETEQRQGVDQDELVLYTNADVAAQIKKLLDQIKSRKDKTDAYVVNVDDTVLNALELALETASSTATKLDQKAGLKVAKPADAAKAGDAVAPGADTPVPAMTAAEAEARVNVH